MGALSFLCGQKGEPDVRSLSRWNKSRMTTAALLSSGALELELGKKRFAKL